MLQENSQKLSGYDVSAVCYTSTLYIYPSANSWDDVSRTFFVKQQKCYIVFFIISNLLPCILKDTQGVPQKTLFNVFSPSQTFFVGLEPRLPK